MEIQLSLIKNAETVASKTVNITASGDLEEAIKHLIAQARQATPGLSWPFIIDVR